MRRATILSVIALVLGFTIGRLSLAGKVAEHEHHATTAPGEQDALETIAATVDRAATRAAGSPPPAPSCPPCVQPPPDDVASLMDRLNAITSTMDLGDGVEVDMKSEHAESASKTRGVFVAKAKLDEDQRAAIGPIVTQLDQALKAPLDRLAALESAEHYAVSDWAQARVEVYQAMASAENSLRDLLSPQQREALDATQFSVASQLDYERYAALVGRGLFDDESTTIEEAPPK